MHRRIAARLQGAHICDQPGIYIGHFKCGHPSRGNPSANQHHQLLIAAIGGPFHDPGAEFAAIAVASRGRMCNDSQIVLRQNRLGKGDRRQDQGGE
jgi:hypothetical protein